tara:strand:+ start:120 stop:929 length:810 start_codon:yes stop_codon:yes gene_type:complete
MSVFCSTAFFSVITAFAMLPVAFAQESTPHTVRTTKFTISDVDESKVFYEDLIGLTEVGRFEDVGRIVEPFMGFGDNGARIGLLRYDEQESLPKSTVPVSVLSLPDLDPVIERFKAASYPIQEYSGEVTGGIRLAIAHDPAGNGIELVEVPGEPSVIGARLVVDNLEASEAFFKQVFNVLPGRRIRTDMFDESFLEFGDGPFVALYEVLNQEPLAKSWYPVVAIYSSDYDGVLQRIKKLGLGVRERGDRVLFAKDPSGNVVEVVRQSAQ